MKNRRSILSLTVTVMLLATGLLLFVMLGGCGEETPGVTTQPLQTTPGGESGATTEPWGTVVIPSDDDESNSGVIEIIFPNAGDGEDGEEGVNDQGGNSNNPAAPTEPSQSGDENTDTTQPSNSTRPTDPTLPTQSGDGDTDQGNQGGSENNGSVGDEDDDVDLEVDFDDLFN